MIKVYIPGAVRAAFWRGRRNFEGGYWKFSVPPAAQPGDTIQFCFNDDRPQARATIDRIVPANGGYLVFWLNDTFVDLRHSYAPEAPR